MRRSMRQWLLRLDSNVYIVYRNMWPIRWRDFESYLFRYEKVNLCACTNNRSTGVRWKEAVFGRNNFHRQNPALISINLSFHSMLVFFLEFPIRLTVLDQDRERCTKQILWIAPIHEPAIYARCHSGESNTRRFVLSNKCVGIVYIYLFDNGAPPFSILNMNINCRHSRARFTESEQANERPKQNKQTGKNKNAQKKSRRNMALCCEGTMWTKYRMSIWRYATVFR